MPLNVAIPLNQVWKHWTDLKKVRINARTYKYNQPDLGCVQSSIFFLVVVHSRCFERI